MDEQNKAVEVAMGHYKPSEIEKYELIREIYRFMLEGSKRTCDILHYFSDKWTNDGAFSWGKDTPQSTKDRTIFNYIARVKELYFNYAEEAEGERARNLSRLDDLYSKMIKIKDYKGALSVVREINEMIGGHEAKQTVIGTTDDIQIVFARRKEIEGTTAD